MTCPRNIQTRKFLLWSWEIEGEHDMKVISIGKFMYSLQHFEVWRQCTICGTVKRRMFEETEDLLREGFSIEVLNNITPDNTFYPKA